MPSAYFQLLDMKLRERDLSLVDLLDSRRSAEMIVRDIHLATGETVSSKTIWRYRQKRNPKKVSVS